MTGCRAAVRRLRSGRVDCPRHRRLGTCDRDLVGRTAGRCGGGAPSPHVQRARPTSDVLAVREVHRCSATGGRAGRTRKLRNGESYLGPDALAGPPRRGCRPGGWRPPVPQTASQVEVATGRISDKLRRQVRTAAGGCCEYCRLPDAAEPAPFAIDHIIARQHRGETTFANLAFSCVYCNVHKGTNLSGIDPATHRVVRLFHPRRQQWVGHFRWDGPTLVRLTPAGRATVVVLRINDPVNVALRDSLAAEGLF